MSESNLRNITSNNDSIESNKQPYLTYEQAKNLSIDQLEIEPYDYFDTILTNNYHLSYRVRKDSGSFLQSLTLVNGNKDIKKLNEITYPLPQKNLGYIGADFGESFLFVQSFGSGNPHEIQLIEKETGNVILNGILVDRNQKQKVLLYIKNEHEENENLVLLDLHNSKETIIKDFNNLKCTHIGGLRNCVELDSINSKFIKIKTTDEKDNIEKKYYR